MVVVVMIGLVLVIIALHSLVISSFHVASLVVDIKLLLVIKGLLFIALVIPIVVVGVFLIVLLVLLVVILPVSV